MDTEQGEQPKGERLLRGRRRRGRRWIPSRENDPKVNACSESGAENTVYTHKAEVFEENQAGEGCDEQERELHAT